MYARSTTVMGSPDRIDQAIAMVHDEVLPAVTQMPGCLGLSMMVDRNDGHGVVTTSWESEQAMRATAQAVAPLREKAANLIDGTAEVEEWEIALMHRAQHAPPGSCTRSTWLQMPDVGRAHDVFQLVVLPKVEELPGFCSGLLLIDRSRGRAVSTIAFADRASLEGTRDVAQEIRSVASQKSGATILDVREHDLVLAHLHVPEMA